MGIDLTGVGSVADLIKDGIDKIWPDKTEQEKQQAALLLTALQGQLDTTKAEAASNSTFVAGWRPNIGWAGGAAIWLTFVVGPFGEWIAALAGHPIKFPHLDTDQLFTLICGMLGLGGMRTYEKLNNINSGH